MISTEIEGQNGSIAVIKSKENGFIVTITGADDSPHCKKLSYVTDLDTAKKWAKKLLKLVAEDQAEVAMQLMPPQNLSQQPEA
jgi:hypothetical protein